MPVVTNKKKGIIIAVTALVVLFAAFLTVYLMTKPKGATGEKTIIVEVIQLDGESREHSLKTDAEFLADALKEAGLVDGVDSEFGFMVTSVDGVAADDSKQQWWKLTVNREFSDYGASDLPIEDGGHYEWTLTEGWDW
ncbi:MAG: DUF4430 domain-containing protein [Oscillospiraceae bacterium]|nr:DUF4430 domain-containing protein [Oscillospiraceae bacterium]